uniref:Neurogenic locus notch homolog protein 2-like n=1 Tax=Saccoglossus kowalevskii TaxID=10224 RepID=A0ABM0MJL7_SACKO|nr:PREDICTED: neurogenic locus notch homolog protein 2-like [Saccoglossus kowalevskii]
MVVYAGLREVYTSAHVLMAGQEPRAVKVGRVVLIPVNTVEPVWLPRSRLICVRALLYILEPIARLNTLINHLLYVDDNPCAVNPCANGGTCINNNYISYTCICLPQYAGVTCETSQPCASYPCMNGGTCTEMLNEYFSCECPMYYSGTRCQNYDDPCLKRRRREVTSEFINDIAYSLTEQQCHSVMKQCQIIVSNPCDSSPCNNGGTCLDTSQGFYCVCPQAYTGAQCQTYVSQDPCITNPCQNGATCVPYLGTFQCVCPFGYTGNRCDQEINPCESQPCQNSGTCSIVGLIYRCQCAVGWSGPNCETLTNPCTNNPCQHSGTCISDGTTYTCQCSNGWTGTNCQITNPCNSNPCDNGGTCTNQGTDYQCTCVDGFTGTDCKIRTTCSFNPCENGGTCTIGDDNALLCTCVIGYTGSTCDEVSCGSRSCENGGVCVSSGGKSYCDCTSGFTGDFCENDIDDCQSNPCEHGTCVNLVGSFSCTCESGYEGPTCNTVSDIGIAESSTTDTMEPWLIGVIVIAVAVAALLLFLISLVVCMRRGPSSKRFGHPGRDNWKMRNSLSNESYDTHSGDGVHVEPTEVATISKGRSLSNGSPHPQHNYNAGFEGDSGTSSIDVGGPV